jgi:putative MATE family efflux protein
MPRTTTADNGAHDKMIKMTTAPVPGLITSLAIPSIAIQITTALYNMADTFFVGSLGTSVVAAVGIAFPLMSIIQAMGFFFGQGSANYMSRVLGAGKVETASRMAVTGLVSGFAIMVIIAVICFFNINRLVTLLGATPTIAPYAKAYVRYIIFAAPWMVAATVLNQQLRFQGSAAIAMTGTLTGAVLNIFLDPLFIFAFGLGISGAAVATMISQMTSFAILLFYGTTRQGNVRINFRHFSPNPGRYAEMFRGGIPSLLRQGLMALTTIIINWFAAAYGDAAIAAISIVQRVQGFANSTMLGFGQGFQPVCGFNYGARLYGRLREGFWFAFRVAFVGLVVMSVLLAIFAPEAIALFRNDPDVIRIGTIGLRLSCISLPFSAWIVMSNMLMQTIGRAKSASLLALSRQGIFLFPALLVLTPAFGLLGIQLATPIADMLSFALAIPLAAHVLKSLR